jgi:type I restriction enzyme M protein
VLGFLFYRFISKNLAAYLNDRERRAGHPEFDYASRGDSAAEFGRAETVADKGFFILPSELFANVRRRARDDENFQEISTKRSRRSLQPQLQDPQGRYQGGVSTKSVPPCR